MEKLGAFKHWLVELTNRLAESVKQMLGHRTSATVAYGAQNLEGSDAELVQKKHIHPEYVKRDRPAFFTYALNSISALQFAKRDHAHPSFVRAQVRIDGKVVISQVRLLGWRSAVNFAKAGHTHAYVRKTSVEGQTVAGEASTLWLNGMRVLPTAYYAQKTHEHGDRYIRKGKRAPLTRGVLETGAVTRTRQASDFAIRFHEHEEYVSAKERGYKPKTQVLEHAGKISSYVLNLVRYAVGAATSLVTQVSYYVLNVIPKSWLPDNIFPEVVNSHGTLGYVSGTDVYNDCGGQFVAATLYEWQFNSLRAEIRTLFENLRNTFGEHRNYWLPFGFAFWKLIDNGRTSNLTVKRLEPSTWHIAWLNPSDYRALQSKLSRGQLVTDATSLQLQNTRNVKFYARLIDANGVSKTGSKASPLTMVSQDGAGKYLILPPYGRYWMPILPPAVEGSTIGALIVMFTDTLIYYGTALLLTIVSMIYDIYLYLVSQLIDALLTAAQTIANVARTLGDICFWGVNIPLRGQVASISVMVYQVAMDLLEALAVSKPVTYKIASFTPMSVPVIFLRVRWDPSYYEGELKASVLTDPLTGQLRGITILAQGFQTVVSQTRVPFNEVKYAFSSPIGKLEPDFGNVDEALRFLANYCAERHHPIFLSNVLVDDQSDLYANMRQQGEIDVINEAGESFYVLRARVTFSGPEWGFGLQMMGDGVTVRNTGLNYCLLLFTKQ